MVVDSSALLQSSGSAKCRRKWMFASGQGRSGAGSAQGLSVQGGIRSTSSRGYPISPGGTEILPPPLPPPASPHPKGISVTAGERAEDVRMSISELLELSH